MPGRPHTLWSRLVLLLERAWVKTGYEPCASSRSEGPCAPCAHLLAKTGARAATAGVECPGQKPAATNRSKRCALLKGTRGRSGAASATNRSKRCALPKGTRGRSGAASEGGRQLRQRTSQSCASGHVCAHTAHLAGQSLGCALARQTLGARSRSPNHTLTYRYSYHKNRKDVRNQIANFSPSGGEVQAHKHDDVSR